MYEFKKWWNHEDFTLKIALVRETTPIVVEVKPGGWCQLDARYTRLKPNPYGGDPIENVDQISPHLKPFPPVEGEKRKVEVLDKIDEKGYEKTKTVTKTAPAPIEESPIVSPPPKRINPNARAVDISRA